MSVRVTAKIGVPIAQVWALISDFGGLKRWHPQVLDCESVGSGVGAARTVRFSSWWAKERLVEFSPESHVLAYSVYESSRAEVVGGLSRIRLSMDSPDCTNLEWSAKLADNCPESVNAALHTYYLLRTTHLKAALGTDSG